MIYNRRKAAALLLIGWILLPACATLQGPASPAPSRPEAASPPGEKSARPSPQPSASDIENRFNTLIFGAVSVWHLPWADDCEAKIREMIHTAAQRLVQDGATPERIELAETNARSFTDSLIQQALTDHADMIGMETLLRVMRITCPKWPFC